MSIKRSFFLFWKNFRYQKGSLLEQSFESINTVHVGIKVTQLPPVRDGVFNQYKLHENEKPSKKNAIMININAKFGMEVLYKFGAGLCYVPVSAMISCVVFVRWTLEIFLVKTQWTLVSGY